MSSQPDQVLPERLTPSLFLVRYHSSDQLDPGRQAALVAELKAAPGEEIGLLFVLDRKVSTVDPKVPAFWLEATRSLCARNLRAMAIASGSVAVRAAAQGFSIAALLGRMNLEVKAFAEEPAAREWIQGRMSAMSTSVRRSASDRAQSEET